MTEVSKELDHYLSDFERFERDGAKREPSWIRRIRKAAISRFAELGFPTLQHQDANLREEWKYTSVAPIVKVHFQPAVYELNGLTADKLARVSFGEMACAQLVFVNGHYSRELSFLRSLPGGVRVGSLAAALHADPAGVEPRLARYASYQEHPFVALNTAFMQDGAFIYIPRGRVVEEPIHLLFVSTVHGKPTVSYPRNLIVVDSNSQATIIESYVGLDNAVYFTNAVTEILADENTVVNHAKLQLESKEAFHLATLQVQQNRSSHFSSHSLALGGALVRNEVNTVMDGEGGECALNGLYLVTGQQQVDNHTQIDHVKPHCTSRELYKGILDGRSRGVFNGKIVVHQAAQETDAKQTNKNLLLSADALIDSKPQLEIFNNDVKCTHGSTIGQLDQDAVFYLRSRGIGLEAARNLLTYAFASEMINRIKIGPIRARLEELLLTRFQKDRSIKEAV